jgi:hypothetical protein
MRNEHPAKRLRHYPPKINHNATRMIATFSVFSSIKKPRCRRVSQSVAFVSRNDCDTRVSQCRAYL